MHGHLLGVDVGAETLLHFTETDLAKIDRESVLVSRHRVFIYS